MRAVPAFSPPRIPASALNQTPRLKKLIHISRSLRRKHSLFSCSAAIAVVLFGLATVSYSQQASSEFSIGEKVAVNSPDGELSVRFGPGTNFDKSEDLQLHNGDEITVEGKDGDWIMYIEKFEGKADRYWVSAKYVSSVKKAQPASGKITRYYSGFFKGQACEVDITWEDINGNGELKGIIKSNGRYHFSGYNPRADYMEIEIEGEPVLHKLTETEADGKVEWSGGPPVSPLSFHFRP